MYYLDGVFTLDFEDYSLKEFIKQEFIHNIKDESFWCEMFSNSFLMKMCIIFCKTLNMCADLYDRDKKNMSLFLDECYYKVHMDYPLDYNKFKKVFMIYYNMKRIERNDIDNITDYIGKKYTVINQSTSLQLIKELKYICEECDNQEDLKTINIIMIHINKHIQTY